MNYFWYFAARRSASPFRPSRTSRAGSEPYVPPPVYWNRESSVPRGGPSVFDRATSLAPFTRPSFRASSLEPLDELFESKLPTISVAPADAEADVAAATRPSIFERAGSPSPTPVKAGRWGPRPTEVAYDAEGKNRNSSYPFSFYTRRDKIFSLLFLMAMMIMTPLMLMLMLMNVLKNYCHIFRDAFVSVSVTVSVARICQNIINIYQICFWLLFNIFITYCKQPWQQKYMLAQQ